MKLPMLWLPEGVLNTSTGLPKIPAPEPQVDQAVEESYSDEPRWELQTVHDDEIYGRYYVEFTDGEGWYKAGVRLDGCIHFSRYFNEPLGGDLDHNENYLHICDIDDMIARLQALKAAALEQFEGNWPG